MHMKQVTIKLDTIDTVKSFVKVSTDYSCDMDLICGRHTIDAKSIMGIFSLNLSLPLQLVIRCDDEAEVDKIMKDLEPFLA